MKNLSKQTFGKLTTSLKHLSWRRGEKMLVATLTGEGETQSFDVVSYKIPNQDKAQRHVERHVELV